MGSAFRVEPGDLGSSPCLCIILCSLPRQITVVTLNKGDLFTDYQLNGANR